MPRDTGGKLNLKIPVGSDDIRLQTIGIDLPYNFQTIDDAFTAHDDAFTAHQAAFTAHQAESAQKHITESGENANGSYIRFDDGTQICTYIASVTDQAITDAYGSLYTGARTWNFPALFASDPVVISGMFKWGSSGSWGTCNRTSVSSADLRVYDTRSRASGENTYLRFVAIGRWK